MGKTHRHDYYDYMDCTDIRPDKFDTPEKYIKQKLNILRRDFRIEPTPGELSHLYKLKTEISIDRSIEKIILNHWGEE